MPEPPRIWENVVRFSETDLHGQVFFGEFFTYMDETFNEYLRRIEYPYGRMHGEGWTTSVVHAEVDFHGPAEYEDALEHGMRIETIGERSLTATYEAYAGEGALAPGEKVHVAVEYGDGDSDGAGGAVRVPDAFRRVVADFQDEPLA